MTDKAAIDVSQLVSQFGQGASNIAGQVGQGASNIAGQVGQGASNVTNQIIGWWKSLPDETKSNVIRGVAGAGGGALLMHLLTRGSGDADRRTGIGPALLGALLGGGAAVAAPYGVRMLKGDIRFGEPPRKDPMTEYLVDPAARWGAGHLGTVAGGSVGGAMTARKWPTLGRIRDAYTADMGGLDPKTDAARRAYLTRLMDSVDPDRSRSAREAQTVFGDPRPNKLYSPGQRKALLTRQLSGVASRGRAAAPLAIGLGVGALADRYLYGRAG